MKNLNQRLKALASLFTGYLLDKYGKSVNQIFLFGSVARDEATNESDIDIFVDAKKDFEKIKVANNDFERTNYARSFRAIGIKNPIRVLVGGLNSKEFEDLRLAIESEGIILFGKGSAKAKGKQANLLAWFTAPKQQNKKMEFLRQVFGRVEKCKEYAGLLKKWDGQRVGKSTILVSIRFKSDLLKVFRRYGIHYGVKNVWI